MTRSLRPRRASAFVLLAVAASLLLPATALAAEVIRFTDAFAIAGFRSTDPTGCVRTTILLVAGNDVDQEVPGAPTTSSGASLRITQVDTCTGTFVSGSGFASDVDFVISPSTREASLSATIPVRFSTATGTVVEDVVVDMTWTATDSAERDFNPTHDSFDGLIVNAQFRGTTSDAVATGTILLDGVNLTPSPSVSAEISFEVGSQVRVETP